MKIFKYSISIIVFFFIISCSKYNLTLKESSDNSLTVKLSSKNNHLSIHFNNFDKNLKKETIYYIKGFVNYFTKLNIMKYNDSTIYIENVNKENLLYKIMFSFLDYFYEYKNTGLKSFIFVYFMNNLYTQYNKNKMHKIFIIEDFNNLFKKYKIERNKYQYIDKYIINYLIDNLYFVSLQEYLERPFRYFNEDEYKLIFWTLITYPECSEFGNYLIKKYGYKTIKKALTNNYDKEEWKNIFDKYINEVEEEFTKSIQMIKFDKIFTNKEFRNEFDNLLKTYNANSKSILFKK